MNALYLEAPISHYVVSKITRDFPNIIDFDFCSIDAHGLLECVKQFQNVANKLVFNGEPRNLRHGRVLYVFDKKTRFTTLVVEAERYTTVANAMTNFLILNTCPELKIVEYKHIHFHTTTSDPKLYFTIPNILLKNPTIECLKFNECMYISATLRDYMFRRNNKKKRVNIWEDGVLLL
jgi:hypothetical protein